MTNKAKETPVKEVPVKDEGAQVQDPSEVQPKSQIEDVTFVDPATHDSHEPAKTEIQETKENKSILKDDEEMKEKVREGGVNLASSAADLSELQRAMVPHPLSGTPVYETASQAIMAQSLKGEL